jgi:hypothetical protein
MASMWPIVRRFGLIALGVVALWLTTVLILNFTLYSAAGHVSSYLRALEAEDYGLAATRAGLSEAPAAFPLPTKGIENPRVIGTAAVESGEIIVQAEYELSGSTETTVFVVEAVEPILYFFNQWRFTRSPTARIELLVIGDNRVVVNSRELSVTRLGVPPQISVLVPGHYEASLETAWLASEIASVTLTDVGSTTPMRVLMRPTSRLVDTTNDAVEDFLEDCVEQKVLQPVGCPFGVTIDDRVVGSPDWEILDYPDVTLTLAGDRRSWTMRASGGVAQVKIQVQSLFDGTVEEQVKDVPFSLVGLVRGTGIDQPVLNLY